MDQVRRKDTTKGPPLRILSLGMVPSPAGHRSSMTKGS
jgi:hypothetical protein